MIELGPDSVFMMSYYKFDESVQILPRYLSPFQSKDSLVPDASNIPSVFFSFNIIHEPVTFKLFLTPCRFVLNFRGSVYSSLISFSTNITVFIDCETQSGLFHESNAYVSSLWTLLGMIGLSYIISICWLAKVHSHILPHCPRPLIFSLHAKSTNNLYFITTWINGQFYRPTTSCVTWAWYVAFVSGEMWRDSDLVMARTF